MNEDLNKMSKEQLEKEQKALRLKLNIGTATAPDAIRLKRINEILSEVHG